MAIHGILCPFLIDRMAHSVEAPWDRERFRSWYRLTLPSLKLFQQRQIRCLSKTAVRRQAIASLRLRF
jgi:hypothetical protein